MLSLNGDNDQTPEEQLKQDAEIRRLWPAPLSTEMLAAFSDEKLKDITGPAIELLIEAELRVYTIWDSYKSLRQENSVFATCHSLAAEIGSLLSFLIAIHESIDKGRFVKPESAEARLQQYRKTLLQLKQEVKAIIKEEENVP